MLCLLLALCLSLCLRCYNSMWSWKTYREKRFLLDLMFLETAESKSMVLDLASGDGHIAATHDGKHQDKETLMERWNRRGNTALRKTSAGGTDGDSWERRFPPRWKASIFLRTWSFCKGTDINTVTLGTQFHMIYGRVILYPNHISFQDTLHFNASVMLLGLTSPEFPK